MSLKIKTICIAAAFLGFTMQMYAQSDEVLKLTVEKAVEQALAENINIKSGQLDLDNSKRSSDYSWNVKLPSLSATAGGSGGLATGDPTEQFSVSPNTSLSLGASVSWNFSKSADFSIESAKLNYESKLLNFENTKRAIEKNVRTMFYKILSDQETINLKKNALDAAKRQYETMLQKYERGALAELDLLNSQISYQGKELDVNTAVNTYFSDVTQFKQLLGLEQNTEIFIEGSLEPLLSTEPVSVEGMSVSYSTVIALEKNLELAELQLKSTEVTSKAPSLSVSVNDSLTPVSWSGSNAKNVANPKGDFQSDSSFLKNNLSASVSARIPLDAYVKGSSASVNIENQKNTIENIKLQIEAEKQSLEIKKQNCLSTIAQIQQQIVQLNKQIELAQKSYKLTLDAYNHGLRDFNTLQTSADNVTTLKGNLMNLAIQIESQILELENILGVPFGTLGVK